ncbi:hypothetical protein DICVIV_04488 [Dictyocaulus viviparus]|uniref:ubiquitinyl hydrolase 1 n=1 Tax=Dictyocaulus viviparus TaxID=29172 RepID=A0A0D8XY32_DICVI|nr:hypothetical protein DICVIV_04488 [Dictyocaulus viviparus]
MTGDGVFNDIYDGWVYDKADAIDVSCCDLFSTDCKRPFYELSYVSLILNRICRPSTSAFLDNPSLFDPRTSAVMLHVSGIQTQIGVDSYSLFAIVTHIGDSSGAGHYISYVRRNQNKWYRCDDHQIKEVHYSDVVMAEAPQKDNIFTLNGTECKSSAYPGLKTEWC